MRIIFSLLCIIGTCCGCSLNFWMPSEAGAHKWAMQYLFATTERADVAECRMVGSGSDVIGRSTEKHHKPKDWIRYATGRLRISAFKAAGDLILIDKVVESENKYEIYAKFFACPPNHWIFNKIKVAQSAPLAKECTNSLDVRITSDLNVTYERESDGIRIVDNMLRFKGVKVGANYAQISSHRIIEDESIGKREYEYMVKYFNCPESEVKDVKSWQESRTNLINL